MWIRDRIHASREPSCCKSHECFSSSVDRCDGCQVWLYCAQLWSEAEQTAALNFRTSSSRERVTSKDCVESNDSYLRQNAVLTISESRKGRSYLRLTSIFYPLSRWREICAAGRAEYCSQHRTLFARGLGLTKHRTRVCHNWSWARSPDLTRRPA